MLNRRGPLKMLSFSIAKEKRGTQSSPELSVYNKIALGTQMEIHSWESMEQKRNAYVMNIVNISEGNTEMLFHGLLLMSQ